MEKICLSCLCPNRLKLQVLKLHKPQVKLRPRKRQLKGNSSLKTQNRHLLKLKKSKEVVQRN